MLAGRWNTHQLCFACTTPTVTHGHLIAFGNQIFRGDLQIGEGGEVRSPELPIGFQTLYGRLTREVADEIGGDKLVCRALLGYVSCSQLPHA